MLTVDEKAPQGQWPLARVIEVHADKKGYARLDKVQTKLTMLTRPITVKFNMGNIFLQLVKDLCRKFNVTPNNLEFFTDSAQGWSEK